MSEMIASEDNNSTAISFWGKSWYNKVMKVNEELSGYIVKNIFPKYERFYSHGLLHVDNVINNMMALADYYDLDKNMAYVIASYHDIGLGIDREKHEYESGKYLFNDKRLRDFFTDEQMKTMREAVEDHRGSRKERPRNLYGECVSDADRDFDIKLLAKRQLATSIKNYPDLINFEEHFERCYTYICKRINKEGVFNLWTNYPEFIKRRDEFQSQYLDKAYARRIYEDEWNRISVDGTKEKIISYYEDY